MKTQFFGQFLLEKMIITQDQLLQALSIQREISPLLGELAIHLELLDVEQSEYINRLQRQQDDFFGDIAIVESLLTRTQVDELLEEQSKRRPYIGEILVELGFLNNESLAIYLDEHQKHRNISQRHFERIISGSLDPDTIRLVADTFPKIYQRICKGSIALTSVIANAKDMQHKGAFWYQDFIGKFNYRMLMNLPSDHGLHMGRAFMQMPLPDWDELAIDAVKEFLNTFTYHVHHHFSEQEIGGLASAVVYCDKLNYELSEQAPCLIFDTGKYACHLIVEVHPR